MPRSLAGVILGEVTKTEVARIKKRKKEVKESLDDFDATCKGFEIFGAKFLSEGRKISHLERRVQAYERVKDQFRKRPEICFEKELSDMAENLDCLDDAKKFLAEVRGGQKPQS